MVGVQACRVQIPTHVIKKKNRGCCWVIYSRFITFECKHNDGQLYALCPLHVEKTPSFTVNEETEEWYCFGCAEGGGPKEFVAKLLDVDITIAKTAISTYEKSGNWILPEDDRIDKLHVNLITRPSEIAILHKYGITREAIEKYRLGWEDTRIIFPIFSRTGYCVNLRKYLPPHRREDALRKVIHERGLGKGSPRFYPYEAFDEDTIFIVEGEKDCIAARAQGINAVTGTGGATLPVHEALMFKDKHVILMVDTDKTGNKLARDYYQLLQQVASSIKRVVLPTKDFVEYFENCSESEEDMDVMKFLEASVQQAADEVEAQEATLASAETVENLDTWVILKNMTIVGTEAKIYTVPTKLECVCISSKCDKFCPLASTSLTGKGPIIDVPSRHVVHFLDSNDGIQDKFVQEKFRCQKVKAIPTEYVNVQKIIFQESASFVDGLEDATFEHRYGMYTYVDHRLSATMKYDLVACRVTDPRTQVVYYVIRDAEKIDMHIPSMYLESVDKFRLVAQISNSAIELLEHYYKEWLPTLAIEGRLDLFGAMLLTYCSVTEIPWQGGIIKGWLDTICVGDTRTGKSQMAQRFVKSIGMGSYINGENARRTGVIGGLQQFGGSWVITWGAIPLNDRGLLVIDEASGLDIDDIKDLSSTRSSGAVTLHKIVKGEARARTRLFWLSNPRSGCNIHEFYWRGYGAFQEFIPAVEDQARFDLVLSAAREDIDTPKGIDHYHEPELNNWRDLVATAWSLTLEDIIYDDVFRARIRESSKALNEEMGGGPLIVGVAVHEKLLRLSCAFAVLSGDVYDGKLKLKERHLEYSVEFLKYTLLKETMSYGEYVKGLKKAREARIKNIEFIRGLLVLHPAIKAVLIAKTFRGHQFSEILGLDKNESAKILSDLIKRGLVSVQSHATYKPESVLTDVARQFEIGGD